MAGNATHPSLSGRTVFVTGGATGIGAALVEAFHDQGGRVAFVDRDEPAGRALCERLGAGCWFSPCDVTDVAALQAAIGQAAQALGPITILINSVANDTRHVIADMTPQGWRDTLAVNLDPAFIASSAVYPMMRAAGGGAIVNMSSITALLGPGDIAAYAAAKGAINALTKSLAHAWGGDRIRVNALSPGWVITPRQRELWWTPQAEAEYLQLAALKDPIEPRDIANAVLFLASDDARMITGQNLVVDAGRT